MRTNNGATTAFSVDAKNQLSSVGGSSCTYDSNGNLTFSAPNGVTCTYDAENQLTSAQTASSWRMEWVYDGRSRLRVRKEYGWSGVYVLTNETRYVYDGMRVIQERNSGNTPTVSYTRGNDLSGSLEGAGGIGGLLARSHGYSGGSWSTHNFYHSDGGGNITYMVDASQGMAASYRYDPYGNTISSSGGLAAANAYRFSSKENQGNSGLYYYGYRFYDPNLQRWLNTDPLGESGFENFRWPIRTSRGFSITSTVVAGIAARPNNYAFVENSPSSKIDTFGLSSVDPIYPFPRDCDPIEAAACRATCNPEPVIQCKVWEFYDDKGKLLGTSTVCKCQPPKTKPKSIRERCRDWIRRLPGFPILS